MITLTTILSVGIEGNPIDQDSLVINTTINGNVTVVSEQQQADWNQANQEAKDFIKNKPIIPAEQIQADWNQANQEAKDFIKNKPTLTTQVDINNAVSAAINALLDGAPDALNTLNELAAALNDDAGFAQTVINSLNTKMDKSNMPLVYAGLIM